MDFDLNDVKFPLFIKYDYNRHKMIFVFAYFKHITL